MRNTYPKDVYQHGTQEQNQQLMNFRASYPLKHCIVQQRTWMYLAGRERAETLVLLTGAENSIDEWYHVITACEQEYRILAIGYPTTSIINTIAELVEGVAAILDQENVSRAHILGTSLGGIVGQCFIRRYPTRCQSLILSGSVAPQKTKVARLRRQEKLVALIPLPFIRLQASKALLHLCTPLSSDEQPFWAAFWQEQVALHTTRTWILSQYRIARDYCEHYQFTAHDGVDQEKALLILQAEHDDVISELGGAPLAELYPHAELHVFQQANHFIWIARQHDYINVLRKFLYERGMSAHTCERIENHGNKGI